MAPIHSPCDPLQRHGSLNAHPFLPSSGKLNSCSYCSFPGLNCTLSPGTFVPLFAFSSTPAFFNDRMIPAKAFYRPIGLSSRLSDNIHLSNSAWFGLT